MNLIRATGNFADGANGGVQHDSVAGLNAQAAKVVGELLS
jgi:hypothetical protein